jgi:hypothetical protein
VNLVAASEQGGNGAPGRSTANSAARGASSAPDAARAGLGHISELTGKEVIGVTSVEPAEDGWFIGVEVVEERHIPSTADLLALYEAEIDMDGTLLAYRRVKRYSRGRADTDGRQ